MECEAFHYKGNSQYNKTMYLLAQKPESSETYNNSKYQIQYLQVSLTSGVILTYLQHHIWKII